MAVSLKHFSRRRHPEVFEQVYLYGPLSGGGSRQTVLQTPGSFDHGGLHVYRHSSPAIEELAQRLLEEDR